MNFRFSDQSLRIRLDQSDVPLLLEKGSLEMATRFPTGKRLRCGVRLARIPEGQKAESLIISFSTETGGFGADLLAVVSESAIRDLKGKSDCISAEFQNPDGSTLKVELEVDILQRR